MPLAVVRHAVAELITADRPGAEPGSLVCLPCLDEHRARYVEKVLATERGELSALDREVVESMRRHEVLARGLVMEGPQHSTFGERMADEVARFGGSWTFVLAFTGVLLLWIALNGTALLGLAWDPFPFILLNLMLSCVAAMQAPIIMMSQRRQESKDRRRAEHDYKVNLKAELEIRHLHAKMDQLMTHMWQRLLEIQEIQTELMRDIQNGRGGREGGR